MDSRIGILIRNGSEVYYTHGGGAYCESDTLDGITAYLKAHDAGKTPRCRSSRTTPRERITREYVVTVTVAFPAWDDKGTEIHVYARNGQEAIRHARHQVFAFYDRHSGKKTYRARRKES